CHAKRPKRVGRVNSQGCHGDHPGGGITPCTPGGGAPQERVGSCAPQEGVRPKSG
ncbi:unnamed protein product, partial [Musa textilis]